ncbi:MAG: hypothetical protein DELT_03258 [Desulfovibrio sp.]|uniref:TetR/AcrR family transcriptional regulator n=1 Tax=Christensenella intestinihominis TaxID=1851429 RepID=UPI00082FB567|nr:TetR/AcrR family transcriptional regulator [Christensenella intestinihominis]
MNKTKDAIYAASVDVFSQSGYTGAAMDEIAERAKVAKGTLYYHFKSKEELFLFVMQTGLGHMIDDAKKVLERPLSPEDKIAELCKSQLRVVRKNENFVKVILSQLFGQEERQRLLRGKLSEYAELISECISTLGTGQRTEKETAAAVFGFLGTMVSAAVYSAMAGSQKKDISGLLIQNYLHGILNK